MEAQLPTSAEVRPVRSLNKKQSLSILSGSNLNKLNNIVVEKPIKDRIISESTGLIKFALRKVSYTGSNGIQQDENLKRTNKDSIIIKEQDETDKVGLPFYIPFHEQKACNVSIMSSNNGSELTLNALDDQEIFYHLATKQREVMELKGKLAIAEKELKDLEFKCTNYAVKNSPDKPKESKTNTANQAPRLRATKSVMELAKKASILNFSLNNLQSSSVQEGDQVGIKKTFNDLATNISRSDFVKHSRTILENINKENEKWFNDLKENEQQNPLLKKLLASKTTEPPENIKITAGKLKNSFNSFITKQQMSLKKQFGNGDYNSYADDSTLSVGNAGEMTFDYSDCIYYDESFSQSPKKLTSGRTKSPKESPFNHPLIEEEEESDFEDYGGETCPYEAR